ncbi:MAG: hypothetical protein KGQ93_05390 [Cyanobacteria bacterium REEB459]|nr:hypothetical protein [Cyanobacteria bacterium REEB459]
MVKPAALDDTEKSSAPDRFAISPLIRLTLLLLYTALMLPLPFLARVTQSPGSSNWLTAAIALGGLLIYAALSQRVEIDTQGIRVNYPNWIGWLFRHQWYLPWSQVQQLKPRSTGQGGLVYYFVGTDQQAYLLPMRVAGFARLLKLVEAYSNLDTSDIKPLAQPWMYGLLLLLSLGLLLVDGWVVATALPLT